MLYEVITLVAQETHLDAMLPGRDRERAVEGNGPHHVPVDHHHRPGGRGLDGQLCDRLGRAARGGDQGTPDEGQDVLLFIDNIFRFTQAGSEVSALLGRLPSAVGYQRNNFV